MRPKAEKCKAGSHRELIVEVDGSFPKGGGHALMQGQGSLQDLGAQLLHTLIEPLEVALRLVVGGCGD